MEGTIILYMGPIKYNSVDKNLLTFLPLYPTAILRLGMWTSEKWLGSAFVTNTCIVKIWTLRRIYDTHRDCIESC